jgi:hypothetical protein
MITDRFFRLICRISLELSHAGAVTRLSMAPYHRTRPQNIPPRASQVIREGTRRLDW